MKNTHMNAWSDYPAGSRHRFVQRRWLVVELYLSYLFSLVGWWLIWGVKGTSPAERLFGSLMGSVEVLIPLVPSVVCVVLFIVLLSSRAGRVVQSREKDLDERQRMVRDRAYRYAYRVIAPLFLLVASYLVFLPIFAAQPGLNLPLPTNMMEGLACLWAVMLIVLTLPTSIITWMERE